MRAKWEQVQAEKADEAANNAQKAQAKGGKGAPVAAADENEPDVLLEDT